MPTWLTPPAPLRPLRLLLVLAAAAALLAAGCSDAHSQAQLDWANTGLDPNVLNVLAPPEMDGVLTALDQAYLTEHPTSSIAFVSQVQSNTAGLKGLTNTKIIQQGATPDLWIDVPSVLAPFAHDPRAVGSIEPFALEPEVLVVTAGNPGGVTGLTSLGSPTAQVGRCATDEPCGKFGHEWVAAAHVRPHYTFVTYTAPMLLAALAQGRAQTGLVMALDKDPDDATVSTVAVTDPPPPTVDFRMLVMSTNPNATAFEKWLATSPAARAVMTSYGLLPGNGKTPS